MIVEAIILGGSSIFVSSLWFAHVLLKREHDQDVIDEAPAITKPAKRAVEILPFEKIVTGSSCPACGGRIEGYTDGTLHKFRKTGCLSSTCDAYPTQHIHMHCLLCDSRWYMRPHYAKVKS